MASKITLDLLGLKHRLEQLHRREVPISEIARGAGVSENGLYKSFRGEYSGVQFDTLGKLLDYARSEGLDIQIGDLFRVESSDEEGISGGAMPAEVARWG